MAVSYMDFTAKDVQYKANVDDHLLFKKNDENYINQLGIEQLNSIGNTSLLDVFLSDRNIVEAHYHQNASELVYGITGGGYIDMINPFTEELIHVTVNPQEVVSIPQGWWHYIVATEDDTHLLTIYDTPMVQTIFGSQVLRITPKDALSYMYCLDEDTVKAALDPIDETVIIGPPNDCAKGTGKNNQNMAEGKTPPKKAAKPTWQPYAPPFPGAFYPKR